jgi:hypothetical protein
MAQYTANSSLPISCAMRGTEIPGVKKLHGIGKIRSSQHSHRDISNPVRGLRAVRKVSENPKSEVL